MNKVKKSDITFYHRIFYTISISLLQCIQLRLMRLSLRRRNGFNVLFMGSDAFAVYTLTKLVQVRNALFVMRPTALPIEL